MFRRKYVGSSQHPLPVCTDVHAIKLVMFTNTRSNLYYPEKQDPCSFCFVSLFFWSFIYFHWRQTERQRKTLYVWSTFQMATIVSTELLRKQEPGARHVCLFVCLVVLSFFFPEFSQLVQGAKFLDHVPLLSLATSMEMKWKWNSQDLKQHRYRIPVFARGGSTSWAITPALLCLFS